MAVVTRTTEIDNLTFSRRCEHLNRLRDTLLIEKMTKRSDMSWLRDTVKAHRKELIALHRQYSSDRDRIGRSSVERIFRSFAGRICSVAHMCVEGKYENVNRYDLNRVLLTRLANELNVFESLKGYARINEQTKPDGKIRATLNFSGNIRAAQFLVESVLIAMGQHSSMDFAGVGKGRHKAVRTIKEAMRDGFDHWLSFDLKNNFPSVKRQHLPWLPLPERVITSVMFVNEYVPLSNEHSCNEASRQAVRQGLPQGAALSGQIAGALLERKLRPIVGENYRCIPYVDDCVVGARNRSQIVELAKALDSSFPNDPAGPLNFKHLSLVDAYEGFEFLGYLICQRPRNGFGLPTAKPSPRSWENMKRRVRERAVDVPSSETEKRLAIAQEYAKSWADSFPEWRRTPEQDEHIMIVAEVTAIEAGTVFAKHHTPLLATVS